MQELGKTLVVIGLIAVAAGALLMTGARIPFLGRLPGDILIQRKNFSLYVPLATSLILSLLLSFVVWVWSRR